MKTLLVTGASGFIGTSFCRIATPGFTVIPVSRSTKIPFPGADVVVHLAARTAKTKNDKTDVTAYRKDNVIWTKKLLRNLTRKPSYFLYVSTMDVTRKPLTLYAASKLEAEWVVAEYCKRKKIPFGIARLGSVFGPGEGEYGKVIPTFIRAALAGKPLDVREKAAPRRFVYVDDVARQLVRAVQTGKTGTFTITGTQEISIGDLAKRIKLLAGNNARGRTPFDKKLLREIDWFRKRRTIVYDVDGTILDASKRLAIIRAKYRNKKDRRLHIESKEMLLLDRVRAGVRELLARQAGKNTLLAVSSRQSQKKLVDQLQRMKLAHYFTEIIAVGPIRPVSAKTRALRDILKRYNLAPSEVTVVGDSGVEKAAAEALGMRYHKIPV